VEGKEIGWGAAVKSEAQVKGFNGQASTNNQRRKRTTPANAKFLETSFGCQGAEKRVREENRWKRNPEQKAVNVAVNGGQGGGGHRRREERGGESSETRGNRHLPTLKGMKVNATAVVATRRQKKIKMKGEKSTSLARKKRVRVNRSGVDPIRVQIEGQKTSGREATQEKRVSIQEGSKGRNKEE